MLFVWHREPRIFLPENFGQDVFQSRPKDTKYLCWFWKQISCQALFKESPNLVTNVKMERNLKQKKETSNSRSNEDLPADTYVEKSDAYFMTQKDK